MVLVTGATGLLGSTIVRRLLSEGARVRILRRGGSRLDLLGEAAAAVEHAVGDVTDPASVLEAMRGVRHVYHAAAYVSVGEPGAEAQLRRVNVEGTAHVVNAALAEGVDRLVHTSSMAAFGRPERAGALVDETAEPAPSRYHTAYAQSKYLSELEVHRGIAEGLDAVILNPSLIFGVGRPGENTMRIVERVRQQRLLAVPTGGTNVVDVRDVAAAHLRAMAHGATGERYFVGAENLSWRAIAGTLAAAFGVPPPRFAAPLALAYAAAAAAELAALATRTRPSLTRTQARLASHTTRYSNRKAVEHLGCTFRPFPETAAWIAGRVTSDE